MPRHIRESLIKVLLVSFVIGVLLAFFNIDLTELLKNFGETIQSIFEIVARVIEWAVKYVMLEAVFMVPNWLIFFSTGKVRGR